MKKIYLYPGWLRLWHLANAVLAILLIITGISIYYSGAQTFILPFPSAILIHNITGILLLVMYLFYIIVSLINGNWKQYIPGKKNFFKGIFSMLNYYFFGIFYSKKNPYPINEKHKFDPLKKIFYLKIMVVLMPLVIITGLLLMFSFVLPGQIFGFGGIWFMDMFHIVVGYILSVFILAHIYFAATGTSSIKLLKAMVTGWFDEGRDEPEPELEKIKFFARVKGRLFPTSFYNPFTLTGVIISLISFMTIIFLLLIETFSTIHNPYLGILTFLILPMFLVVGIIFIVFGIFREYKRNLENKGVQKGTLVIDLNNPRVRKATAIFSIGTFVLLLFSLFGSYQAYEYTESDEFCGTICHVVMNPEYSTYKRSPHSKVGCVQCHIGSGAGWFVKSKLSGLYQVYAVLTNSYPRPIPTPVSNLRPAEQTCEHCHSPRHFYNEKKVAKDYYISDEKNTKFNIEMSIKVGGGNPEVGDTSGIHWHMNLANEIQYYHTDRKRYDIPWVKAKSRITGEETVYYLPGFKADMDQMKKSGQLRTMDCIDCHSRPSHIITPTAQVVNLYMSMGRIDPAIPYIKQAAVQALESPIETQNKAYGALSNFTWNFYKYRLMNMDDPTKAKINKAIQEMDRIYKTNYFPNMNVSWKEYQVNIGHMYSPGCFRCHDGKHQTKDGRVLTNNCNNCHTFKSEVMPTKQGENKVVVNDFIHPGGDTEKIKTQLCTTCHGVTMKFKNVMAEGEK